MITPACFAPAEKALARIGAGASASAAITPANMTTWIRTEGESRKSAMQSTITIPITMNGHHARNRDCSCSAGYTAGAGSPPYPDFLNRCCISRTAAASKRSETGTIYRSKTAGEFAALGSAAKSAMMTGVG